MAMTQTQLADAVAERAGTTRTEAKNFLTALEEVVLGEIGNAEKVKMTGMKADQKVYHRYTGYPGGLRSEEFKKRAVRKPEWIIEDAIKRMLPKTKLGTHMFSKLKVYKGDKHPHQAQKPEEKALA